MFAKLFSRITQSSLMEEPVEARYCFMMMLAIADTHGYVIGTDVAIARVINLPLPVFQTCIAALCAPDPDSNSQEAEGRRIVKSEGERGYFLVNYTAYRQIKSEEEKRAYMREYMRQRRKAKAGKDVTDVKFCKTELSDVTQGEGEGEEEGETHTLSGEKTKKQQIEEAFEQFWKVYPKKTNKAKAQQTFPRYFADFAKMLPALARFCQTDDWRKEGGKYIPNPQAWLNGRRWEDEGVALPPAPAKRKETPPVVYFQDVAARNGHPDPVAEGQRLWEAAQTNL